MLYKSILKRLTNPSVLVSVVSQIALVLLLMCSKIDVGMIPGFVAALILILLGIISDPNTLNKGYGDDLFVCSHCQKVCEHVMIEGKMICRECGTVYVANQKKATLSL